MPVGSPTEEPSSEGRSLIAAYEKVCSELEGFPGLDNCDFSLGVFSFLQVGEGLASEVLLKVLTLESIGLGL